MPSAPSHQESLAAVPLFASLAKSDLQKIARASDEVAVRAGRKLTEQGRLGHEFFLILEGEAAVKRNGRKVATLGPGQYFGELAILDKGPRDATVEAATDMRVLVLGQGEFLGVLDSVPGLANKLLRSMAKRLRDSDLRNVAH